MSHVAINAFTRQGNVSYKTAGIEARGGVSRTRTSENFVWVTFPARRGGSAAARKDRNIALCAREILRHAKPGDNLHLIRVNPLRLTLDGKASATIEAKEETFTVTAHEAATFVQHLRLAALDACRQNAPDTRPWAR